MSQYSIKLQALFRVLPLLALVISTTTYAKVDKKLSFMASAQSISIFRFLSVFAVIITLIAILFSQQESSSKCSVVIGILLTIFGLLHVSAWSVNYMVIGMGLIALSGVLLAFENGISKLIYLAGLLLISIFASIEFGTGSRFIQSVALIYIIGAGLLLFVPDNSVVARTSHINSRPVTQKTLFQQYKEVAKVRDRAENAGSLNIKETKIKISRMSLTIVLLMVIVLAIYSFSLN